MKYNILKDGKKKFNYRDSAIGEFGYILIENLLVGVLTLLIALGVPNHPSLSYVFSFLIELGFVAAVLISSRLSKTALLEATNLNKKITFKQAGFVVLVAFIAMFGLSPIANTFSNFFTNIGFSSGVSIEVTSWGYYFLFIFLMAIVPAFCEEMLFRGLIYNGLKKWNKTGAIFISALLFMLMHGNPEQTIHQFLLGIILALLMDATGSIWAPMLLHFLNNFLALTANFIYNKTSVGGEVSEVTKTPWGEWALYGLFALLMTAIVAYLIWVIYKYLKNERQTREALKNIDPETGVPKAIEEDVEPNEITIDPTTGVAHIPENYVSSRGNTLSIVLFALSGVFLVIEWLSSLLLGIL